MLGTTDHNVVHVGDESPGQLGRESEQLCQAIGAGHHGLVQGYEEGHQGGDDEAGAGGDEMIPQSPPVTARQHGAPA